MKDQLSAAVRETAGLRHLVALARYRVQLADKESRQFMCALGSHEAALQAAERRQGASVLRLLTCGMSHRRALLIVRRLKL